MFFILEKALALYIIFFDKEVERLPWARELHVALSDFFRSIEFFAKYIMLLMGVKERAI